MAPALGSLWLLLLLIGQIVRVTKQVTFQEVKVTSGHIKSQQVTSGRPTTGHGFAHEVAVHLTCNENILKQVQYTVIRLCFDDLCYTRFLAYVFAARRARDA